MFLGFFTAYSRMENKITGKSIGITEFLKENFFN